MNDHKPRMLSANKLPGAQHFPAQSVTNKLVGILLLGLMIRIVLCFGLSLPHVNIDTKGYFEQADQLLEGGYVNYFPNGYPFVIAFFKLFTGTAPITLLLWLNIVLGTACIYFVFGIAEKLFSNVSVALLSALLLAIFPTQLNYVRWLLTEVPTVFFLLGFYFFYFRERNIWAGLFFGLGTVVRTEVLAIFLIILLVELFFQRRVRWQMIAAFLVPVITVSSYCYLKTGVFAMAGHSKVNLLYSITASGGYVDWYFVEKHPEVKTSSQAMAMYIDFLKDHPGDFFKNKLANLWELWGFFPSSSDGNRSFGLRLLIGGTNFFLLFFGGYGAWLHRKKLAVMLLLVPFLIVTGIHTLLLALPRYTYTAEPFLIILAVAGLYHLFQRNRVK